MFNRLVEYVQYVQQAFVSLRPPKDAVYSDIYGRPVEHADEFFHPVKFRGIPVFDPESILSHVNYQKQIDRLREVVDIGDHRKTPTGKPLFDELYIEILKRFIEYVHMIPASEDHHHAYTGGLLTHSIEASIEALRWSKELKCQITHMADQDTQIKPILDYAAWLGCLLHDVGKIMRDISVDAVEVIHPLTKRPIPLKDPIVSWFPQKESLTQWAKSNHISAYSVTWIRNRTHNRHNIDSAQILSPLLQGTFAMDYLLSSPIKQELFSELGRCLSGYTQHKGHLSDCIRMGDSVSTNRALQIQYDSMRGHRRISTATKLYQCINHARKTWEWNRPKAQGWVIGNEAYIRWSSAFDSIVSSSLDLQYGLPTDTRNILTIMEQNGFAHLFDPESPNDRILKFTPGNFNTEQKKAIISGKQSVTWIDLIKMVTPHVVFGEQPMPPSMAGIIFLPSAKLFFAINKDGDIAPLQAPQNVEAITNEVEAIEEQQALPTPAEPTPKQEPTKKQNKKPQKPASITEGFKPSLPKPAQQSNDLNHSLFDNSAHAGGVSINENPAEKATPKIQERIEPTLSTIPVVTKPKKSKTDVASQHLSVKENNEQAPAENDEASFILAHNNDDELASQPQANVATPGVPQNSAQAATEQAHTSEAQESRTLQAPVSLEANVADTTAIVIPKNLKVSNTFAALMEKRVVFYKTKTAILIDASDAESKLERVLIDIIKDLKSSNELHTNPMTPLVLTEFHKVGTDKVKCIALAPQLVRLFAKMDEGTHNAPATTSIKENTQAQLTDNSIKEGSAPEITGTSVKVSGSNEIQEGIADQQTNPKRKKETTNQASSIPAINPIASTLTTEALGQFINKETCHRNNGSLYIDLDLLSSHTSLPIEDAFIQLRTMNALHVCALEPEPKIFNVKKSKGTKRYAKLSHVFDSLLPSRKPPVLSEPAQSAEQVEANIEHVEADSISVSLRNFAKTAGEKSLVHFLVAKNVKGLIDYLADGNLKIELSAIAAIDYKPFSKLKIGDSLELHGATKQDGHYLISHANLLKISMEDI